MDGGGRVGLLLRGVKSDDRWLSLYTANVSCTPFIANCHPTIQVRVYPITACARVGFCFLKGNFVGVGLILILMHYLTYANNPIQEDPLRLRNKVLAGFETSLSPSFKPRMNDIALSKLIRVKYSRWTYDVKDVSPHP
jgi:hypothetical protein